LPKQFDETELAALDLLDEIILTALERGTLDTLDDLMLETVAMLELDLLLAIELATLALLDDMRLDTGVVAVGIEHSLTPPATVLPAPKVSSLHTKLPLNTL
jgi:hypothetical protein